MSESKQQQQQPDLVQATAGAAHVHCPACETIHSINLGLWEWDGGSKRPSFHPSLLVYRTVGPEHTPERCHSFIRDGKWQYLEDSTHAFAGKVVDMLPITPEVLR